MNDCLVCCPRNYEECLSFCPTEPGPEAFKNLYIVSSVAGVCLLFLAASLTQRCIARWKESRKNAAPIPVLKESGDIEWQDVDMFSKVPFKFKRKEVLRITLENFCLISFVGLASIGMIFSIMEGKWIPKHCCASACELSFKNVSLLT